MAVPRIIDFSPFLAEVGAVVGCPMTPEQKAVIEAIAEVSTGTGFAYIDNIGISADDLENWFGASKELFAMPEVYKLERLEQMEPAVNVGYSPIGQENLNLLRPADLKESYNVRGGINTFVGCPDRFIQAAENLWEKLSMALRRFALASALALGVEPDFFTQRFCTLDQVTARFLHYPPCAFDPSAAEGHGPIRIGEHTDFGLFTLLFMDGPADGLEVKKVSGGETGGDAGETAGGWMPVPGLGGATFVVNTGALLARMTNDNWRATAHRVVVPSAEAAAVSRYTIACFCDPDTDAMVAVDPRFVAPGHEAKYPPITAGEYVFSKLSETNTPPGNGVAF